MELANDVEAVGKVEGRTIDHIHGNALSAWDAHLGIRGILGDEVSGDARASCRVHVDVTGALLEVMIFMLEHQAALAEPCAGGTRRGVYSSELRLELGGVGDAYPEEYGRGN
jgi:hypothetical protein